LGKACEICQAEMVVESRRLTGLRDRMIREITTRIPDAYVNGHSTQRLPHNVNISYAYVEGESLLMGLKEVALSSGSACTSASLEPSYVLKSLGVGDELAHSSIRYGLGRFNTEAEVDYVIGPTIVAVHRLLEMSSLLRLVKDVV